MQNVNLEHTQLLTHIVVLISLLVHNEEAAEELSFFFDFDFWAITFSLELNGMESEICFRFSTRKKAFVRITRSSRKRRCLNSLVKVWNNALL